MLEETIGVAVFTLRRTPVHHTEVLLLKRAHGELAGCWSPVVGRIEAGEREADAALRELLEETALTPARLYAATFSGSNDDPTLGATGRIGVFVAYVEGAAPVELDGENSDSAWCPIREAGERLPLPGQRRVLDRIIESFVRTPPDEALRIV